MGFLSVSCRQFKRAVWAVFSAYFWAVNRQNVFRETEGVTDWTAVGLRCPSFKNPSTLTVPRLGNKTICDKFINIHIGLG